MLLIKTMHILTERTCSGLCHFEDEEHTMLEKNEKKKIERISSVFQFAKYNKSLS